MNNAERRTDLRTQGSRTGRKAASAGILPAGDAGRKHNKLRRGIRCVSDGCEDYAALPDITSSPERIMQLLTQLADGAVTPVSLREIVEDWL